ncbi:hypothetical protein SCH4B_1117 [Ruegeria sp. TrichCH4B]|nr:hypothetical protein SCH4B_1117 [Ruegeria sp. TrichCH4B]
MTMNDFYLRKLGSTPVCFTPMDPVCDGGAAAASDNSLR